jgi:hypothetical protein
MTVPIPLWPTVQKQLNAMQWEVLRHPAYSLGLLPCDFQVFQSLQKAVKGCTFMLENDVHTAVVLSFGQQTNEFYANGIR